MFKNDLNTLNRTQKSSNVPQLSRGLIQPLCIHGQLLPVDYVTRRDVCARAKASASCNLLFCENVRFVCPDKRANKQKIFRKASFHVVLKLKIQENRKQKACLVLSLINKICCFVFGIFILPQACDLPGMGGGGPEGWAIYYLKT